MMSSEEAYADLWDSNVASLFDRTLKGIRDLYLNSFTDRLQSGRDIWDMDVRLLDKHGVGFMVLRCSYHIALSIA